MGWEKGKGEKKKPTCNHIYKLIEKGNIPRPDIFWLRKLSNSKSEKKE